MATMAGKRDYYEVLGVGRTAADKEIASAYRKLAIKYHPDSNGNDAQAVELFKEAAEAYEVLGDPEKRARYDRYGHEAVSAQAGSRFHNVEDIFDAFGDMFGDSLLGDLFGRRGGGGRKRVRRGSDLRCDVELDLAEAAAGCKKTVRFARSKACGTCGGSGSRPGSKPEQCKRCGGHGQVVQSAGFVRVQTTCPTCQGAGSVIADPCEKCRGQGATATQVKLDVSIPPGVDSGMRIRLAGEGEPSPDGGPTGDAYCFITVREHALFRRDGTHLILQLPITFSQAALGAELEVPTLTGRAMLHVPPGTAAQEVFRLRGKGLQDPRGGHVGDLLVQTFVEVPAKLTRKQEELLRELAELENKHVSPHRKSFLGKLRDFFAPTTADDKQEKEQESP